MRAGFPALALLLSACSGGSDSADIPALPKETAETGNALMAEAEKAANNAAARGETARVPARSAGETENEVTP